MQTERERVPIMEAFQTTPAKRGLFIGLGVMLLQQFTGCNAVIFYTTYIFKVRYNVYDILFLSYYPGTQRTTHSVYCRK